MMYVHFPAMDDEEKLETLTAIDWAAVEISPDEALRTAGIERFPREFWLEMAGAAPVYRILDWYGSYRAVSAVDGHQIQSVSADNALGIVQRNLSAPSATLLKTDLQSDQWTVAGYWNELRPFHLVALNDDAGTHYYVSIETGEIVLDTVRWERFWNYLGAVPHWVYFEFIRSDTGTWFWVIIVMSGIGTLVAASGLWLGVVRIRLRRPYGGERYSPFNAWMKWHHIAGVVGGVFLLAWMITGLLSMYPGGLLEQRAVTRSELESYAGNSAPWFSMRAIEALAARDAIARQANFVWLGGKSFVVLDSGSPAPQVISSESGAIEQMSDEELFAAASRMMPNAVVRQEIRLVTGDEYWHSGFSEKKLPMLRVEFDDPSATWFHIDPATGKVVGILDNIGRLDRWTNSGVHGFDLAILHKYRPLWDIVVWILMLAGLFISVSGVVIGVKRLNASL